MKQLVIVDDFYANPLGVREMALCASFANVEDLNYPGFQSDKCFASASLRDSFSKITGESLEIDQSKLTFGRFRVMLSTTRSRLKIHVDDGADWSGLVYLNLPDQCRGGTAFYKHKATGLRGPPNARQLPGLGFVSAADFQREVIEPDTLNEAAWERTMFVGMRFNRLVLFRGCQLFHSHTCGWGREINDGRLTQNFFFNSISAVGEPSQPSTNVLHSMSPV